LATVPGYEILGILGKGGMGIVYQARHLKLNRVVALKMILSGAHAGTEDRLRFRTEAEAVARLQHSGIVQIYEVGEHEALPFLALEFCPGGSLDKRLAGTPLPPREAAQLVERLARAVQSAHDKNVIHRDLKPSNVLLAEDGTPKIIDFGLAKRLDEAGRTQSGAVLGTPSYMAPEQAGGKTKVVGPAADVYALGAILYECLTGRPPFQAPTWLQILAQVQGDDPVPPRQLQPAVPRDLETICLKCLRKEPGQRYGSATELAEDLARFLSGEPIAARPVGAWQRAAKWVRRRPAVAALLAFSVLVLVSGTMVSLYFAVQAKERAKEADASAEIAKGKEQEALTKEKEANDAREQTEAILARSLLRPLGHNAKDINNNDKELNNIELDALWELAESPSERVRLLFVANALETEDKARQLANGGAFALQATEGLDRQRRQEVEQMLLHRLRDDTASFVLRSELARGIAGTNPIAKLAQETARLLSEALAKETNAEARRRLAEDLAAVARRLAPEEAPRYAGTAARLLSEALAQETEPLARWYLLKGFWAVAGHLAPEEAKAVARLLSEALAKEINAEGWRYLAEGFEVIAEHLAPEEAARYAGTAAHLLSEALAKETDAEEWTSPRMVDTQLRV
jgi:truncated hemoglobin YjbI